MEAICFVSCLMIGFPPRYQCYLLRLKLFLSSEKVFSQILTQTNITERNVCVTKIKQ